MSGDLVTLVNELSPYAVTAIGAYGAAVLSKAQEEAVDVTVGWGRKILQKIFGVNTAEDGLPSSVAELIDAPEDADLQAALRVEIRRMLAKNATLAAELAQMLEHARRECGANGQGVVTALAFDNARQYNLGQGTMNISPDAPYDR
ncbi:hypothetical protein [Microtetraspora malaysiensis]|uniref:Uncharacterized protein n=1 Tax=Microtetraspora malaysiensis TaxID=161358 RepID=A0ABW6SX54_9ACTN